MRCYSSLYFLKEGSEKFVVNQYNLQLRIESANILKPCQDITAPKDTGLKMKLKSFPMIKDLEGIFNRQISSQKKSAIREVLKLTQLPDIISFAGGLPAPESFPVKELKNIVAGH